MSEPARKIAPSLDQVRAQFAKLGLQLPASHGKGKRALTPTQKLIDFGLRLGKWGASLTHRMSFKIIMLFAGTQVTAGLLVYYFEHASANKDQFTSVWDGIWWGIVTITTTGYGDKFPVTLGGRVVAGVTMCIGIITAGITTGNIASWLVDQRLKASRGLLNLSGKQQHLVICGWRREMDKVLEEIFHLNPHLQPDDVVIIAPISQEILENFKSDERFSRVNILRGEYYTQTMLEHASVKYAEKVLILSDWSTPNHTVTEVDAKTVMTAMTIEKIAPQVYVAAELIDLKFESYLHLAHCDEIIYSKEYTRILLANSARNEGLAHIVYDLLNVDTPAYITTVEIPQEFVGKTYQEVRDHFKRTEGSLSIGLLENTGNLHTMKKQALKKAQKNPDTRTVLRDLKEVRSLRTNIPVLNPPSDFVVKDYSMAILVENREIKQNYQKRLSA